MSGHHDLGGAPVNAPVPRGQHAILPWEMRVDALQALPAGKQVPEPINPATISRLINQLATTREVYFLHPSYGHQHLEWLYLRPHGLVYEGSIIHPPEPQLWG